MGKRGGKKRISGQWSVSQIFLLIHYCATFHEAVHRRKRRERKRKKGGRKGGESPALRAHCLSSHFPMRWPAFFVSRKQKEEGGGKKKGEKGKKTGGYLPRTLCGGRDRKRGKKRKAGFEQRYLVDRRLKKGEKKKEKGKGKERKEKKRNGRDI